jgi:hypothetical protein
MGTRASNDNDPLREPVAESNAAEPAPGQRAPGVLLTRISGPLNSLLLRGVAREAEGDKIDLFIDAEEAAAGGMVTIAMRVPVRCTWCGGGEPAVACERCAGTGAHDDLFSAWLAIRPGVADGTILTPSAWLPGMVRRVYFRVRLGDA